MTSFNHWLTYLLTCESFIHSFISGHEAELFIQSAAFILLLFFCFLSSGDPQLYSFEDYLTPINSPGPSDCRCPAGLLCQAKYFDLNRWGGLSLFPQPGQKWRQFADAELERKGGVLGSQREVGNDKWRILKEVKKKGKNKWKEGIKDWRKNKRDNTRRMGTWNKQNELKREQGKEEITDGMNEGARSNA